MTKDSGKLDWVQAIRGLAALLVVFCHCRDFFKESDQYPLIEKILLPGAMGVDLFFIISGFIMVYSTRNNDGSLASVRNFAVNRFFRVWPTYFAATIFWILIVEHGSAFFDATGSARAFFESVFFIPVNKDAALYFGSVIPVGWTLNFEMYFYAIFGASLLFRKFRFAAFALFVSATVIIAPLLFRTLNLSPFNSYRFDFSYFNLMTNPIILEFFAGALIGKIYLNNRISFKHKWLAAFTVLAASVFVIWYNYFGIAYLHGIKEWGFSLAVFVLCLAIASKTIRIPTPQPLIWIGKVSFSLYVTHLALVKASLVYFAANGSPPMGVIQIFVPVLVITIFAVAAVFHRYVETQFSNWLKGILTRFISSKSALPASL
ncbi:acyltransferase [Pseudomonas sp. HY13-MNA-CIBAN-0226]|uniref:acyltransferase family protein n=1 Tax=Pseudomonas sp. HY13-MNA-CIBAN-0226 TaxID=3140473 RepID=UPI003333834C